MGKLRRRVFLEVGAGWLLAAVFAFAAGPVQAQDAGDPAMQNLAAGEQAPQSDQSPQPDQAQEPDPPSVVARISLLIGNVSIEPASVNQFTAADQNYPLTTGDRIYADTGANAELETDKLAVRLGQATDLTVTAMTDTLAQLGLAQGSVHLRSFSLDGAQTVELDTPNVAVTVTQVGDVRVDVDAASDTTTVTVVSGQVQVDGNGLQQTLQQGQRVRLGGSDPVSAQWLYAAAPDGLDSFSANRDGVYESAVASESQYVNPGTIGSEDLSANGEWQNDSEDGPVWYPTGVAVDWAPYSCGRWAWIAPWGWTWVGCERWGFAPFHYGRWNRFGRRWGWIPGPPVVHPIYSPGLVVFVGGAGFRVGGIGVTAWFPLGPHEPYVPWYHASTVYENRINVSGIYNRNVAQVRMNYNRRGSAVFADAPDRAYVNRQVATTAIPETNFAAGRPVASSMLRLSGPQMESAQVLPHPLVTPQRSMVVAAPARAVPARVARPELASHEETGQRPAVSQGSGGGLGIPARAIGPAKVPEDVQHEQPAPSARPAYGQQTPAQQAPPVQTSSGQARIAGPDRVDPSAPTPAVQRPLFNKAVPPEPRPSFDVQQKAIESTDPGRPLSPQQLNNLRQERPAGPEPQRETPHPAPAPRSAPAAPRPSAPPPSAPKH
jgi:hypothetical protein